MSIPVRLQGVSQDGTTNDVEVGTKGFLQVAVREGDPPTTFEVNRFRYYSALLGSTGADSGTTNQNVDGSVTAQEFYIEADPDFDIRIMKILVFIGDSAVTHGNFGNVSPLTNGWTLRTDDEIGSVNIINAAKTTGQVVIQSATSLAWGDSATSFELTNYSGTQDASVVIIPIFEFVPNGLRIGRGSVNRITSVVNDDLTGLDDFTVRILGYRHYP